LGASDWSPLDVAQWRSPQGVVVSFIGGSGFEMSGLYNGPWTLYVRYLDRYGQFCAPVSSTFRVDTTPPTVVVASPRAGDTVSNLVPVVGSAFDGSDAPDLQQYALEYGQGSTADRVQTWSSERVRDLATGPVVNDTLAFWDTAGLYGSYVLRLRATDRLAHESRYALSLQVAAVAQVIDAETGGRLSDLSQSVELYIPPRGLPQSTQVTITPVDGDAVPPDRDLRFAGLAYDIAPADLTFGRRTEARFIPKPAVLTVRFRGQDVLAPGAGEHLRLYRFFERDSAWTAVGGTIDSVADGTLQLRAGLERAGRYALMAALAPAAVPTGLSGLSCQPRVFGPGTGYGEELTIMFVLRAPAVVRVKVYDPAGRLQRRIADRPMDQGSNAVLWDGRDEEGEPLTDGMYVVAVEAGGAAKLQTVGLRH
jgi:hypothetical protein